MNARQDGFTLIELVVVIIILGILAAVAVPKFVNLQGSARTASLNGLRAAVNSASNMANSLQTASGLATNASVTMDGSTVTMVNGYPTSDFPGIGTAVRLDSSAYTSTIGSPYTFTLLSASNSASCFFTYSAATLTQSAVVSSTTSTGC